MTSIATLTSTVPATTAMSNPAAGRRTPGRTVAFACAAMFVSYLPFSAVNGSLAAIGAATGAATAQLQWLTDAFALALAAVVLAAGTVGDTIGRRRLAVLGLGATCAGALLAVLTGGLSGPAAVRVLWVAQGIAGLGGGAVMSSTLGLVTGVAVDDVSRRRGIAVWAASITLGLAAGPFVSAALLGRLEWRWLFVPLGLAALVVLAFGNRYAQEVSTTRGRRLDLAGLVVSALGVVAVVYAVVAAGSHGWTGPGTVIGLLVAAALLAVFVRVERRRPAPLLDLRLFHDGAFLAAGAAAAVMLFSLVGLVFVSSLVFAHTGAGELDVASRLGCLFVANAVTSVLSARLQRRMGAARQVLVGLVVAAAGCATLVTAAPDAGLVGYAWRLALAGAGGGLVMAGASVLAVSSAAPQLMGMAGAANNALRQLGAALGAAVLGTVLAARRAGGSTWLDALRFCGVLVAVLLVLTAAGCALLLRRR